MGQDFVMHDSPCGTKVMEPRQLRAKGDLCNYENFKVYCLEIQVNARICFCSYLYLCFWLCIAIAEAWSSFTNQSSWRCWLLVGAHDLACHALRTLETEPRYLLLYPRLGALKWTGLKQLRAFSNKTRGPSCCLMVRVALEFSILYLVLP